MRDFLVLLFAFLVRVHLLSAVTLVLVISLVCSCSPFVGIALVCIVIRFLSHGNECF